MDSSGRIFLRVAMSGSGSRERRLARILIRTGAIRFGMFTLTSGMLSPYYLDMRLIPSFPSAFKEVISLYEWLLKSKGSRIKFQRVAGIPSAGIPYAAVLAHRISKPFLYVRKEAKKHGMERRIEGLLMPGDSVLVVDDLITTGSSTLEAVDAIRAEGGKVTDAFVLIDRQQGGAVALRKKGVRLHCFVSMQKLAKVLRAEGAIDDAQLGQISQQIRGKPGS